jgi:outer membrane lipoprotein LolB
VRFLCRRGLLHAISWVGHVAALASVAFLCACATRAPLPPQDHGMQLHGRMALWVTAPNPSSLSAEFELQGSPQQGSLELVSALGLTLARLQWDAHSATLQAQGNTKNFDSLQALAREATGVDIPVDRLFDWAQGIATPAPGWQVDTSLYAQGRITAQRLGADLRAELRLLMTP